MVATQITSVRGDLVQICLGRALLALEFQYDHGAFGEDQHIGAS
jgi:hypothetical protein